MLVADMAPEVLWLPSDIQVMSSDAHAVAGRQRRTRRRGAAVGYQAGKASASESQQQQQQEPQQQQQAAAQPAAAPAPAPSGALPQGTMVKALPEGCTAKVVNGVEYQFDGKNYYRAAFQGNELVYVTSQP